MSIKLFKSDLVWKRQIFQLLSFSISIEKCKYLLILKWKCKWQWNRSQLWWLLNNSHIFVYYNHSLPLMCLIQLKLSIKCPVLAEELSKVTFESVQWPKSPTRSYVPTWTEMFICGWRSISDHYVIDGIRGNICWPKQCELNCTYLEMRGRRSTLKESKTCRSPFLKQCIEM